MMENSRSIVQEWSRYCKAYPELYDELMKMNESQLQEAFHQNIRFGTGGIRGIMGVGTNRLNVFTVQKVIKGYAQYILNHNGQSKGICIAYDNRKNSLLFSQICANVLSSYGIHVHVYPVLTSTPQLSFAIRELKAFGGIVITASHNPKEYNGIKMYNSEGCQCVPKESDEITSYVNNVEDAFTIPSVNSQLIHIIDESVITHYYEKVEEIQEHPHLSKENFKVVYTPLHGTGYIPCTTMLSRLGYQVYVVEQQCSPDPEFSHTTSVNPEDQKAYIQAIALAKNKDADIIIASDPDCDRLGVVVKHVNEYMFLTGNQTGAILLQYLLRQKKIKQTLPKNGIVFNTVVTSNLGAKICEKYGVEVESTLTGFKFIGDKIQAYQGEKQFLFGYEESYGYLIQDFVRDKDGVQSTVLICEVANYYKQQNKTLIEVLNEIYDEYGQIDDAQESVTLLGLEGKKEIERMVSEYRNESLTYIYGKKIICKEDFSLSKRYNQQTIEDIHLPKTNLIKLYLEDESWIAVRPSGNEPKIKIYKNMVLQKNK